MRRVVGVVVLVAGLLVAVAGAAVMVVLGPDDRASTGPHPVETVGVAVVTAPRAISYAGPTVSVLVEVPDDKPVFVGLGNAVDVRDYLGRTERLTIERVRVPWRLTTREDAGSPNLTAAPTALDWWIAQSAGLGGASITVQLPDEPVSLAVLAVGDTDLEGLRVTTAYEVPGGFLMGGGAVALGAGAALLGLWRFRTAPPWRGTRRAADGGDAADPGDLASPGRVDGSGPVGAAARTDAGETEEEVVYVLVDEDGREREISAAEAVGLEVVDERVESGNEGADEAAPEDSATASVDTPDARSDEASGGDDDDRGGWRERLRRALGVDR